MSGFALGLVLAGAMVGAEPAAAQPEKVAAVVTTADALLNTVTLNEAATDEQMGAKSMEIRGTAKRINRTESGSYVLQFLPDHSSENFVRLHIDFEFKAEDRAVLAALKLPAEVSIRGSVKQSGWQTVYDNHRHYKLLIKDSTLTTVHPIKDFK